MVNDFAILLIALKSSIEFHLYTAFVFCERNIYCPACSIYAALAGSGVAAVAAGAAAAFNWFNFSNAFVAAC